jgi:hypothetical protein
MSLSTHLANFVSLSLATKNDYTRRQIFWQGIFVSTLPQTGARRWSGNYWSGIKNFA